MSIFDILPVLKDGKDVKKSQCVEWFQQMLKTANLVKISEARAGEALRSMLEKIPILQVESIESGTVFHDWGPDFFVRLLVHGRPHNLICEYKSNGQPRYARSAVLERRN